MGFGTTGAQDRKHIIDILETEMVSGAEAVVRVLEQEGIDTIFGIQGGKALPLFQALGKHQKNIAVIGCGQEGGAGHMAEGYAESTGKIGVFLTTSGPGATNSITPLYDADMDAVPIIGITCNVNSSLLGTRAFQEANIFGMSEHCTKQNYLVTSAVDIAGVLREAFFLAKEGRPGSINVDITEDALKGLTPYSADAHDPMYSGSQRAAASRQKRFAGKEIRKGCIDDIVKELAESHRPIIYAGGGVKSAGASDALHSLADTLRIPVTTTLKAIGCFPSSSELCLGMPGMHGTAYATHALYNADLVLILGSRVDDRIIQSPAEFAGTGRNGRLKTVVHVDIDASEIHKRLHPGNSSRPLFRSIPVNADVKDFLNALMPSAKAGDYSEWHEQIAGWRKLHPMPSFSPDNIDKESLIPPQYVIQELNHLIQGRDDVYVTTGVGQHQMFAAQYLRFDKPRRFITSGGSGTMGFGLPAAVGAQAAHPGSRVINIDGDGSFNMNIQELRTIADYGFPVKTIILHNGTLGMVRQWQDLMFNKEWIATTIGNANYPNFAAIARGYGIESERIEQLKDVSAGLDRMFNSPGSYVLDIMVDPDQHVLPMVMPGKQIDEMIMHKKS
jgi:acetolactate synthase I/II/III large subunit